MSNYILDELDLLSSIENINFYPFNLNDNLYDNVIETKKEIELEYFKNFIFKKTNNSEDKKNKHGSNEMFIYIY